MPETDPTASEPVAQATSVPAEAPVDAGTPGREDTSAAGAAPLEAAEAPAEVAEVPAETPVDAVETTADSDDVRVAAEADGEPVADASLLAAHDVALAALREITAESSIGAPAGHRVEADGVVSLLFANNLLGYPGWFWTVSVARVSGAEPTVLEAELLPGEDALLAPDWVPWAVRLAEYQAAQVALAEAAETAGDDEDVDLADEDAPVADVDDDDDDDDDDLDETDFDSDASPILHSGDLDGVDIDELDPQLGDDDDSDDDDLDDDSDDDDSVDDSDDEDPEDDDDDDSDDDDSDDDDSDEDDEEE